MTTEDQLASPNDELADQRPGWSYQRGSLEFGRALTFFDATFALALTLLVTTLDQSTHAPDFRSVGALTSAVGTGLFAFFLSFVVVANYWLNNHRFSPP